MGRYVYDFPEGGRETAELLGDKGAGLAELARLGLPVPAGFTVTTEAGRALRAEGTEPEGLMAEVSRHLRTLEREAGRLLGGRDDPLLVSVRPDEGAARTVLDIGLNDGTVTGLAKASGSERFAWDSYRRLVHTFGSTVMGVESDRFETALTELERDHETPDEPHLDAEELTELVESYKRLILDRTGRAFPQSPAEQLGQAILAVLRAHDDDGQSVAVTVQRMVYGDLGPDSGSGVAVTHDPVTGRPGPYGAYLPDAQGADVSAGVRDTLPLTALDRLDPASHRRLSAHLARLEELHGTRCALEFTIERGTLWLLRARVGTP